ncbi:sigma-70 family RNA polymerase sigma factor [Flavobacterium frigoris]|jgi:RNA polymerase sigma-70 factor (ECF subfamily)|uniref:RNA polymerase sigma-70 factor, ECF subfamily n=1 Tax=Flavobacterium frigoris TaxID=229204 RepID=A0A1H9P7Q4_FLAFI|nr:sigma-70 family RNA polymerase sigma factor [Flavobacterium frigoris]SER44111.1 RNA polymerase sigma-70 factor, ECF subfamily [Flavobacterium frigoris]
MNINQIKMGNSDCFSDDYLFQQIRNGQYEAMELFFNRYYTPLCRFGLSYESNSCLVEEKVADIFIQLWNSRNILDKIKNPKSYIYVVVKNSLKTVRKSEQFHQQIDESKTNNTMFSPSREQEIIENEEKEISTNLIREILDVIPKKSRQAFELSRIDGLKYKEISVILNVTPKTVENHIAIALKYISKALESHKKDRVI